jgi:ATP-dependent helicase/nuclease subunit B
VDYKSSSKKLEPVLMANGLQLQLPAYLSVLRHWPDTAATFGVARLKPAGVFYVSLHGKYKSAANRVEALEQTEEARLLAYRHNGRFDAGALRNLDSRHVSEGTQFNYKLKNDGDLYKQSKEALQPDEFRALLEQVESSLKAMGERIFAGEAQVSPYRKGSTTACEHCDYGAICRIDAWTHTFRKLTMPKATDPEEATNSHPPDDQ